MENRVKHFFVPELGTSHRRISPPENGLGPNLFGLSCLFNWALIILAILAYCSHAKGAGLEKAIEATVKVSAPDGQGTGCFFAEDADNYYVLTCYHVAGGKGSEVLIEAKEGGINRHSVVGVVAGHSYTINEVAYDNADISIVAVKKNALKFVPPLIPISTENPKGKVYSVGHPEGNWANAFAGKVIEEKSGEYSFDFYPKPVNGRSGSAVFNEDCTAIVGLICWAVANEQYFAVGRGIRAEYLKPVADLAMEAHKTFTKPTTQGTEVQLRGRGVYLGVGTYSYGRPPKARIVPVPGNVFAQEYVPMASSDCPNGLCPTDQQELEPSSSVPYTPAPAAPIDLTPITSRLDNIQIALDKHEAAISDLQNKPTTSGESGKDGKDGVDGAPGPQGPPGEISDEHIKAIVSQVVDAIKDNPDFKGPQGPQGPIGKPGPRGLSSPETKIVVDRKLTEDELESLANSVGPRIVAQVKGLSKPPVKKGK